MAGAALDLSKGASRPADRTGATAAQGCRAGAVVLGFSMSLSPFDAAAILIALAASLGYLNHRFIRLPHTVGLAIMGALASLAVIGLDAALPGSDLSGGLGRFLARVDFQRTLMDGMLSFLLFAGALHVDLGQVRQAAWPIGILSTLGVLVSTLIVATGFWALGRAVGHAVPFAWCLVFGALISPTDPVAVLGILKSARTPPLLAATVGGESLFNDGVGVVLFTILVAAAAGGGGLNLGFAGEMFLLEAGGGAALGLVMGWAAFRAMRSIDDYNIEVMISLAVVMGGYVLADRLGVSGPVAMAVAGLLIGNQGVAYAMSNTTRDYLIKFWALLDDILNSVLFLLIGLEAIALIGAPNLLIAAMVAVPLALLARAVSVGPLLLLWRRRLPLGLSLLVLSWGGLRGGISIALALSLPETPFKGVILASTYAVVMVSVVIQGGSLPRLLGRSDSSPGNPGANI